MEEKLIFFDIDGTLIECNLGIYSIPETTRAALKKLQENGHSVFLATGRCKCFIVDGVYDYPFSGYVTCNGAYVEYQGKEIFKKVISKEAIEVTHRFCQERNMAYYFEGNEYIYVLNKGNPKHLEFQQSWGMKEEVVVDDYNIDEIETYIGMIVVNSHEDIEPMFKALSPYFDIQRHQSDCSFDLTLKGVSKAVGILKLVECLDKDMKDTIAFGDGRNDIEMLETVNLGIAMKNACQEAKEASDYVTDSVHEDGIKKALQHFCLL